MPRLQELRLLGNFSTEAMDAVLRDAAQCSQLLVLELGHRRQGGATEQGLRALAGGAVTATLQQLLVT